MRHFLLKDYTIAEEEFYDYDNDISNYTPLFLAVHDGDLDRFNTLLNKCEVKIYIHKKTIMHVAAARGHAQIVDLLCQRNVLLISRKDGHGNTPLHLAVMRNHPEVFNVLLNKSDLNATNFWDKRPLHFAAADNRVEFAEMLINHGANVNAKDMDGNTPLFFALEKNHVELAELLLQNGADVRVADIHGNTPLHIATRIQSIHLVEVILEKGARVNVLEEFRNWTPIEIAACFNDIKLVNILLKHGAKVDQIDAAYKGQEQCTQTMTSLHYAARRGNLEMVKLLKENGFDTVNVKNEENKTPLCFAVYNNHLDIVKYLIENGSKIVLEPEDNIRLLRQCSSNDHLEILKYLMEHGIKGESGIHHVPLFSGDLIIWKYLLTCISKIDAKSCSRETKLHSAVRAGQVEIVKEIINKQTERVASDSLSSKLAVYIAVENENEEILKILLEAGYSVESCFPNDNLCPLHIAATFEHTRFVEMLLKAGADINSETENGVTPLEFAVAAGRADVVKFLLDAGANSNLRTSLEYAVFRNYSSNTVTQLMFQNMLKIVEMLIIAGGGRMKIKKEYDIVFSQAIALRVSSDNEQISSSCSKLKRESEEKSMNKEKNNKNNEFRPEIVRCLLNYSTEFILFDIINKIIDDDLDELAPDSLSVVLEYDDSKSRINISRFNEDYWNNLHIIGHIEDVDILLKAAYVTQEEISKYNLQIDWTDLSKTITARLVMLFSDLHLEREKLNFYKEFDLLCWRDECRKQIKSMQTTKLIDESNVTVYNILNKPVDKVARYIRDEKILNSLESSCEKFPAYSKFLELRIKNGKQRNDLNDMCVNGMLSFIRKNYNIKFSCEGIQQILQYLSAIDLRRLSAACFELFLL